jgi:hypothetical protein
VVFLLEKLLGAFYPHHQLPSTHELIEANGDFFHICFKLIKGTLEMDNLPSMFAPYKAGKNCDLFISEALLDKPIYFLIIIVFLSCMKVIFITLVVLFI